MPNEFCMRFLFILSLVFRGYGNVGGGNDLGSQANFVTVIICVDINLFHTVNVIIFPSHLDCHSLKKCNE